MARQTVRPRKTRREQSLEVCERHLQLQLERLRLELGAVRDATWRLGICPANRIWPQAIEEFIDTGVMPYGPAPLYTDARQRVLASPQLSKYMDIILSDGYASDEDHLRWVITGKVGEIVEWADTIRRDSE